MLDNFTEAGAKGAHIWMIAILGTVLGYMARTWGVGKTLKVSRVFFAFFAAIFTTLLVRAICRALNLSEDWTIAIVGICAWFGTDFTVEFVRKLVFKKLGITDVIIQNNANTVGNTLRPGVVYRVDEIQKCLGGTCESPAGDSESSVGDSDESGVRDRTGS